MIFRTNVEYKEKRKNSIIDEFHDVIHEGDMYYHLNLYSNCAHGLTLRNAVFLYKNMHPDIKKLAIDKREKEAHNYTCDSRLYYLIDSIKSGSIL